MAKEARTVVKTVKGAGALANSTIAVLYSDGTIRIDHTRWSYPHVLFPYESTNDDGKTSLKFNIVALMPKATHKPALTLLTEVRDKILAEKKVPKIASDKFFVKNGDDSDKTDYEGHWTVSASESKKIVVKDADKRTMSKDNEADVEKIFGGVFGSILIRPWWQDHKKYGKRINAGLVAVQYLKTGEAFGEGRISEDEIDDSFDSYEDEGGDIAGDEDDGGL